MIRTMSAGAREVYRIAFATHFVYLREQRGLSLEAAAERAAVVASETALMYDKVMAAPTPKAKKRKRP